MLSTSAPARRARLFALAVTALATLPLPAAAQDAAEPDPAVESVALVAPFSCGTRWQGTTYSGHGSHDWNLDFNLADGSGGSDLGQPILAQADGTVVWFKTNGYNNHAGTYIEIDYGDITARYVHLVENSIPEDLAEIGATVARGETIGLLGSTGRVTGPHLHLEYWDSAGYDDTAWYQLPRENHIPVQMEGEEFVATPGQPTTIIESTNCPEPTWEDRIREMLVRRSR